MAELGKIYYNLEHPAALGGLEPLVKAAKENGVPVSRGAVKKFLEGEDAYTLHKPARKNYPRQKTIVGGIDKQWQADLVDMNTLASANDGYRYILTVIDCFSKYGWAQPARTKDGASVSQAFMSILKSAAPRKPARLQTDKGKEFFNPKFQDLCKLHKIQHFASNSDKKAAIVERFNRTIKTKMWRYFTWKNTRRYLETLPSLLKSYNMAVHRGIGMAPINVTPKDELRIWRKCFAPGLATRRHGAPIKAGDHVRLSKVKGTFDKGYLPNWTEERFKVAQVGAPLKPPVYKLKDTQGEPVQGIFYKAELQRVSRDTETVYKIEKVLARRKIRGAQQLLVKWQGYPDKFNSWVDEATTINI